MRFRNRAEAGKRLALRLLRLRGDEPVVFAASRAGIIVAYEVAQTLRVPLQIGPSVGIDEGSTGQEQTANRTAIVVDDELRTDRFVRTAIATARRRGATRIVIAAPIAAHHIVDRLRALSYEVITVEAPPIFGASEEWYEQTAAPSDEEIGEMLNRAASWVPFGYGSTRRERLRLVRPG